MHDKNYSYPLDPSWSTAEIETVIAMFRAVEDAYEVGINRQQVMDCYRKFKMVVSAKSEEKRLGREFAKATGGYQLYDVVKAAREQKAGQIKLSIK
ncbi:MULTISPECIES: UPF0223 family protein [Lactobacillaceae]|uniref:UPF0223 family protein n=1 Tax=Lactobacillaceae TaxID=33958 RepID=UPI00146EEC19|nr:UPF0223 family protein [Limosilactobacillus mucosae]MDF9443851.1 UPF0223 family protein [Limosilactobacillus mucosae]MDM8220435.1 UPF0223 family protein [Limosilactobacillus mucosae]MDM8315011.1 UPF0223 family protein [Limosilactobacillus mucosae]NME34156.1 UPF0223 family protein [Lactobacillus sp. MRS-253-APC-2B]